MPDLDPVRAAFVQSAYRHVSATDNAVKATYSDAREITLDTSLASEAAASTFASAYLAEFKVPKRYFELTFRGTLELEDWLAPPTFTLNEPKLNAVNLPCKAISATVSYKAGTTTMIVRAG